MGALGSLYPHERGAPGKREGGGGGGVIMSFLVSLLPLFMGQEEKQRASADPRLLFSAHHMRHICCPSGITTSASIHRLSFWADAAQMRWHEARGGREPSSCSM